VLKVIKDHKVSKVIQEDRVVRDQEEIKDHKDYKEQPEDRVTKAHKDSKG
jgi:hypothetical protein